MGEKDKGKKGRRRFLLLFFLLIFGILWIQGQGLGDFGRWPGSPETEKKAEKEPGKEGEKKTDKSAEAGSELRAEASRKEDAGEKAQYESPIDFTSLRRINPDIVAWLQIPGTGIDYPVVQTTDNEKYLKTDFEGNESSAGAIYLDCDSDRDLRGWHCLIYGHHMRDGSMFAPLMKFKDEDFFRENREIVLYLPGEEIRLRTVAALYGNDSGEKRKTEFDSQEHFRSYVDEMTRGCGFRELPEEEFQNLYSFVTCSYEFDNARTILYAVPDEGR